MAELFINKNSATGTLFTKHNSADSEGIGSFGSAAGMEATVDLEEVVTVKVCIYLCGGYTDMPEELLDHPEVSSALQKMGGEAMSQSVRTHG